MRGNVRDRNATCCRNMQFYVKPDITYTLYRKHNIGITLSLLGNVGICGCIKKTCHRLSYVDLRSPCAAEDSVTCITRANLYMTVAYVDSNALKSIQLNPLAYALLWFVKAREGFWRQTSANRPLYRRKTEASKCSRANCATKPAAHFRPCRISRING